VSIRFLADADLDGAIVRGVHRHEPSVDLKSANDADLEGLSDPEVLELAAAEGRVLVSHDTSTMPVHFAARSRLGLKSPGVLLAFQSAAIGDVIESLLIIWSASREEEWAGQIHYLPSLSRHVFR
jgi:hypothetical protein